MHKQKITIKRSIHPEVILEKKDHRMSKLYKIIINLMKRSIVDKNTETEFIQTRKFTTTNEEERHVLSCLESDSTLHTYAELVYKWTLSKHEIFYFPKEFVKALADIKLEVTAKYLPKKEFIYYFVYPENILRNDDNDNFCEVIIHGCPAHEDDEENEYFLSISATGTLDSPNCTYAHVLHLKNEESVIQSLCRCSEGKFKEATGNLVAIAYNSLIYLASQNPNCQVIMPEKTLGKKEKKQPRDVRNYCGIPLTLVNQHFHNYNLMDSLATRKGHFRWQPCGTNRKQVKLIWITEHLVTTHIRKKINGDN
jgi:hypothetical protein